MDHAIRNATLKALLGGAVSGGLLGAGSKLVHGERALSGIAAGAGRGAALAGGIAGGATYLGSSLMGAPDPEEHGAFTHRGALGGALGGGVAGGALGSLAAAGRIAPTAGKDGNLIYDYFRSLARKPSRFNTLKGGLVGAVGLGALGTYLGGDEGMQIDAVSEELRRRRMAKMQDLAMGDES